MIPLPDEENPPPAHVPCDVVLRDGSTARVRVTDAGDAPRVAEFLRALSPGSRALRFCGAVGEQALPREAERLVGSADGALGLVATVGGAGRIIGHAMFVGLTGVHSEVAEVALVIADEHQGQGLGTILLGQLAQIAAGHGVRSFTADVLAHNRRMLHAFQESGFPVTITLDGDDARVDFPIEVTGETLRRFDEREWTAAVNAMRPFFEPRSVAVIGASRRRESVGGALLHNLLAYPFAGPVFPVHPDAPVVQGIPAYPGVEEIPGPVDLAVIAVPAEAVVEAAEACARKGVRALVVVSAGFAESGALGRSRQDALLQVCRMGGMRLIGPNCMGIVNSDPAVQLNATIAPVLPVAGRIAFMSQSGALGQAIMGYASARGLGVSTLVSVGNKADISGNDLVRYWAQDAGTDVILLYLESFGNPRKFSRIARQVARGKPIVAVKSGRSPAGAHAAGSHTGALLGASDLTVDALFRHAGVIRADTLREMFDIASLLATQPAPRGRRVALITNAGGPAILCADACQGEGLEIPRLAGSTLEALRPVLPAHGDPANPVDLGAAATPILYRRAIEIAGRDPGVDALIVILAPTHSAPAEDTLGEVSAGAHQLAGRIPVLAVVMQPAPQPMIPRSGERHPPVYAQPEDAARSLAKVARYGEWLAEPASDAPHLEGVRRKEALAIVAGAVSRGAEWLSPEEAAQLLRCYGLSCLAPATGDEVQPMAPEGVEMIVGVVHDPRFGPVVACGAGGVVMELLKDVSVRLTPLSRADAEEMVRELKTYPLLTGYRGAPPCDVGALVDAVLRVAALVDDLPQVVELDLNPIIVHPAEAAVVDARVRVAPPRPSPLLGQR
ncbi:MAG TPA: GNAT family N-acetyltransferase [Longimicrobium sp.]|jgi:acetyl coenzyme A synthetase (ADP forming)-like protein|uniref:bifunctional acetate--CoA ligase family protein/GNAT family N-acetyltransferase n=1 Tax=Longimicrobium sp. TaxID=2029185 RepID=UPI002EDB33AC